MPNAIGRFFSTQSIDFENNKYMLKRTLVSEANCVTCGEKLHSREIFNEEGLDTYVGLIADGKIPYAVNCCECNKNLDFIEKLRTKPDKTKTEQRMLDYLNMGKFGKYKLALDAAVKYEGWLKDVTKERDNRKIIMQMATGVGMDLTDKLKWTPEQIDQERKVFIEHQRWERVIKDTSFLDFAKNYLLLVGGNIEYYNEVGLCQEAQKQYESIKRLERQQYEELVKENENLKKQLANIHNDLNNMSTMLYEIRDRPQRLDGYSLENAIKNVMSNLTLTVGKPTTNLELFNKDLFNSMFPSIGCQFSLYKGVTWHKNGQIHYEDEIRETARSAIAAGVLQRCNFNSDPDCDTYRRIK